MKTAGVDSCPGGGAEIFHPRVRRIICDHKVSGNMWLTLARKTHEAGLRSNATMLYGHVENGRRTRRPSRQAARTAGHHARLRHFHSPRVSSGQHRPLAHPQTYRLRDLRNIAVSRLLLDNFEHIKAYWIMLTPSIAQIALRSVQTTSTEQLWKKKFITTLAPRLLNSRRAPNWNASSALPARVLSNADTLYNRIDRSKLPPLPAATPPVSCPSP